MALVERAAEVRLLRDVIADAGAGAGSVTVITGQLGVGKTALLNDVLSNDVLPGEATTAGETRVLSASASTTEQEFDFGVACQLLEPLIADADERTRELWFSGVAEAARWLFPGAPDWPGRAPGSVADVLTAHGLQGLFSRISADGPLVVLVDDLQFSDQQSLNWLRHCARQIHELPCALIVTVGEGDAGFDQPSIRELWTLAKTRIRPAKLSAAGVEAVVRAGLDRPVDGEFVSACHAASAGNPLYLTEVVRGDPSRRAWSSPGGISADPPRLKEWLTARLATLPPQVTECVKAVAVLGEHADPPLIEHLTGCDSVSVAEAVRVLDRLGVLSGVSRPRFAAPVVRTAIEASMTVEEDLRLRVRAAHVLHEAGFAAETVAAQLLEVPTPSASAWMTEELRTAADAATLRGEPTTAARYLRRALLDVSPDDATRGWRLVDLALTEAAFDLPASIRHLTQAVQLLPSARERTGAVTLLPLAAFVRPEAAALVDRVSEDGSARPALRLEARIRLARCEDPAMLESATERLRAMGPVPPVGAVAERELLAVLLHAGSLSARVSAKIVSELADRLLRCAPASPLEWAGTAPLLIHSAIAAGAVEQSSPWLESTLGEASRGGPARLASLVGARAAMQAQVGQLTRARTAAREACALVGGDLYEAPEALVIALAGVAMITRDDRLAVTLLGYHDENAMAQAGLHVRSSLLMLRGAVAAVDDTRGALACFLDAGGLLDRAGWRNPALFPWRTWAAWLQRRLGDLDSARELIEDEVRRARRWGAPAALGRALRVEASLSSGSEASRILTESIEMSRASGDRLELARALLAEGKLLRKAGNPESDARFREAYRLAEGCGAPWLTGRTVEDTAGSGAVAALSDAERRVVEFALNGLTNGEIAAEVNVTRRAVEKHLTSCYRKLGISGRAELAEMFGAWGFGSRSD